MLPGNYSSAEVA